MALERGVLLDARFVIRELLGIGGTGEVHRAFDRKLRRDVALKLVSAARLAPARASEARSEPASGAGSEDLLRAYPGRESDVERYTRAFIREARAAGRLPHANVLVVHDVRRVRRIDRASAESKRWVGMPFIVSELLRGTPLGPYLSQGPVDVMRGLNVLTQLCDAVACAHRAGMLHGDLKPGNVFVTEGDRIKVLDFGLARSLEAAARAVGTRVEGTRGYVAPERLAAEAHTTRADVWALGVLAFELYTARHPFGRTNDAAELRSPPSLSSVRPDVPRALEDLITRCLAFDAQARPPSAVEVLYELWRIEAALEGRARKDAHDTKRKESPFPGLRAFDESDAKFFFGRMREVKECVDLLIASPERRWLAIEGASGAGKSSLARAGVVPALKSGWLSESSERWRVVVLSPGRDPLRALEEALVVAFDAATPRKRAVVVSAVASGTLTGLMDSFLSDQERILLFVDQLEELYTLSNGPDVAARFDALLATLLEPDAPAYLLTTVRSDFLHAYARLPQLAARLNSLAVRYHLGPMDPRELAQALLAPAALAGLRWDPGLPERILTEVGTGPGVLPLIAHLLAVLWDSCPDGQLSAERYEALGGLAGALGRSADETLALLDAEAKARARGLMLALVRTGRGTPDTRRVLTREQALEAAGGGEPGARVLHVLSTARLLVVTDTRVEIVHEAILDGWPALVRWRDDERRALERRDDLEAAALVWNAAGRAHDGLARGAQLAYFDGATTTLEVALDFLAASRQSEREEEDELARRLRRRVASLSAVIAVLLALSVWAVFERNEAKRSREVALGVADQLANQIDRRLGSIPGTSAVREQLLETSDRLLVELGEYPETMKHLAVAHRSRAEFASETGQEDRILVELETAAAIGRELIARDPQDLTARVELSRTLGRVRYERLMLNRVPEAIAAAEEGVAVIEPAYLPGARVDVVLAYASALRNHAAALVHGGKSKDAARAIERELDVLAGLAPDARRSELAECWFEYARVERIRGHHAEASAAGALRIEIRRSEVEAEPDSQMRRRALAWSLTLAADNTWYSGQYEQSIAEAREAVELAERTDAAEPETYANHRDALIAAEERLADALIGAGDAGEARAHAARALSLTMSLERDRPALALAHHFVRAYRALCELALREHDLVAAVNACEQGVRSHLHLVGDTDDGRVVLTIGARLYNLLGDAFLALGRDADALVAYGYTEVTMRMLAERDEEDLHARHELARALLGRGARAEALLLLEQLVRANPDNLAWRTTLIAASTDAR